VGLLQPMHLIIILIVVLIIFGPGKLPDAGKAFGKMIQEFRAGSSEGLEDQDNNHKQNK
jgi:sec-independent protein translocase protein TatA